MNKQVNLPYNSMILVNVAPLTKTFECTNLKAFPSFHDPILSDSKNSYSPHLSYSHFSLCKYVPTNIPTEANYC